jgi:hypothetical protein
MKMKYEIIKNKNKSSSKKDESVKDMNIAEMFKNISMFN